MASIRTRSTRGPRACVACQRMKMKCVRIGSSCVRCQRGHRECILPDTDGQARRSPYQSVQPRGDHVDGRQPLLLDTRAAPAHRQLPTEVEVLNPRSPESDSLPTIYSASPFSTVCTADRHDRRDRPGRESVSFHLMPNILTPPGDLLTRYDMKQLISLFCERVLPQLPMFTPGDFDNADRLIELRPILARCVCYVTSTFLPEAASTMDALYPTILHFLQNVIIDPGGSRDDELANLQCLMLLFSFAKAVPGLRSHSTETRHLFPAQMLKGLTESYAIHLDLHRAVEDVRKAIRSTPHAVASSDSYRRYTYWLWLFSMAHHSAVLTGTPPTIRGDSSIQAATTLFSQINTSPQHRRLLGEVELCLLWEKASVLDSRLGEWWCRSDPSESTADRLATTALQEAFQELQNWWLRWSPYIKQGGYGNALEFHYHYTRFCISTYALRSYEVPVGSTSTSRHESVKRCVDLAVRMLRSIQALSPVSKDRLRYISDFGFVMMAYPCLFVLQAYQTATPSLLPDEERDCNLGIVASIANLMVGLALNSSHCSAVYGSSIQSRVASLRLQLEKSLVKDVPGSSPISPDMTNPDNNPDFQLDDLHDLLGQEACLIDSSWDPSVLFSQF